MTSSRSPHLPPNGGTSRPEGAESLVRFRWLRNVHVVEPYPGARTVWEKIARGLPRGARFCVVYHALGDGAALTAWADSVGVPAVLYLSGRDGFPVLVVWGRSLVSCGRCAGWLAFVKAGCKWTAQHSQVSTTFGNPSGYAHIETVGGGTAGAGRGGSGDSGGAGAAGEPASGPRSPSAGGSRPGGHRNPSPRSERAAQGEYGALGRSAGGDSRRDGGAGASEDRHGPVGGR